MPEYTFTWPQPQIFPETRDAKDKPLGLVKPGDIRDLDQADHLWRETTDEDRAALAAREAGTADVASVEELAALAESAADGAAALGRLQEDGGTETAPSTPETPPAPQPAPPAAAPTT
jgi:hypothetical protein